METDCRKQVFGELLIINIFKRDYVWLCLIFKAETLFDFPVQARKFRSNL